MSIDASTPKKYRKKPVEVEAVHFTGGTASLLGVCAFIGSDLAYHVSKPVEAVFIRTLEGTMKADVGDYVIRGVQGEFYPCKPDIFAQTYEEVSDS